MNPFCAVKFLSLCLVAWSAQKAWAVEEAPVVDPAAAAHSRFAKLGEHKVHYKSLGEGNKAVVLVHGWSCNHTIWKYQTSALNGKARLILIDLPGHGKSDRPRIDYTMEHFAKAIDAVLVEAGVQQAALVGHSMGTPVVRQYSRLYPKKTIALVAVDGMLLRFGDKKQIASFISQFEQGDFKAKASEFVDGMFAKKSPSESIKVTEARDLTKSIISEASQHVAVSAMRNIFDDVNWKDDVIEAPIQLIFAEHPRFPKDYKDQLLKIAPRLDFQPMSGVGHLLFLEKPEEFNQRLSSFLKSQGVIKNEN